MKGKNASLCLLACAANGRSKSWRSLRGLDGRRDDRDSNNGPRSAFLLWGWSQTDRRSGGESPRWPCGDMDCSPHFVDVSSAEQLSHSLETTWTATPQSAFLALPFFANKSLVLFFFFLSHQGLQDSSSPTRDQNCTPGSESTEP